MATAFSSNLTLAHEADPEKTSNVAPSISSDHEKDLEKGDTTPPNPDTNEVDQGGLDRRRTEPENNVVAWDGPNDPQNPQNWSKTMKYTTTVLYATCTFTITFASSIFSTATEVTAKEFGVSLEVMTLGTSLFVLVGLFVLPAVRLTNEVKGLCCRPVNLGTLIRAVWTETASLLWLRLLRHLSNTRGRCYQY